jgi:hypothetical protein
MSATRDPDRIVRAWLDLMPDEAPDRAIANVLHAVERTPQVRLIRLPGRWKDSTVNRYSLLAAAAALIVVVAGASFALRGPSGPGGPPATPTASPTSPSASPSQAASTALAPLPDDMWGDWVADVGATPGLGDAPQRIQLSAAWQDGLSAWVQLDDGSLDFYSASVPAGPGEIRLVSSDSLSGCTVRDEGRYRWSRSPDGLFLTLELIEDACALRATTLARSWVRSLGAVNDGGPGIMYFPDLSVQVTLPAMRFAMGPLEVHSFDEADPRTVLVVAMDPMGFAEPCSTSGGTLLPIDRTTDAFVSYVRGLPGFTVDTTEAEVGGYPAIHLSITTSASIDCPIGEIKAFHPMDPAEEGAWTIVPGDPVSLWIVDVEDDTFLFWYEGDEVTPTDEEQVISTVRFLDTLPTP